MACKAMGAFTLGGSLAGRAERQVDMSKHTQLGKVLDREHENHRNLIAAAPAMLEALLEASELLQASYHDMHNLYGPEHANTITVLDGMQKVERAIAQATGDTVRS